MNATLRSTTLGIRAAALLLPLAVLAAGCSHDVTGPSPTLPGAAPGTLPAEPGIVCGEQVTTVVTLHGTNFSPVVVDIPDDERIDLPTVRLVRNHQLDGQPADGMVSVDGEAARGDVVTFGGARDDPNVGRLSWKDQTTMAIVIEPGLDLPSGQPGDAPAGLYDLEIQNPNGDLASTPTALAVTARPKVAKVAPPVTCVAQGPRDITLTGEGFFRINGVDAVVALETVEAPFPVKSFEGCTTVAHPAVTAEYCSTAVVTLGLGSVEPGYPGVQMNNPETAPCHSTDDVRLRVVPPPVVQASEPPMVCVAEGPRDVVLRGTGFLEIDGVLPAVTLDGVAVTVNGVEDCETLPAQGAVVRSCTGLSITVPQQEVTGTYHQPAIEVTNPEPAGCNGTHATALTLVPPPTITELVPPAVCLAQADRDVEIVGTGFLVVDGAVPAVTVGGLAVVPVASSCEAIPVQGMIVQTCTRLTVTMPLGSLPAGEAAVTVTNPAPAGCGVTAVQPLLVVDPPVVTAVEPPLVCTGDAPVPIVVRGSNFVQYGQTLPEVRLGGTVFPADRVDGCTDHTLGTLSWKVCTEVHVTLPLGSLTPGPVTVQVTNPPPVDCQDTAEGLLVVPPVVRVISAEPAGICSSAGDRTVVVRGEGFLIVGGTGPTVTLNGQPFATSPLGDCTDLVVPGLTVQTCGSFSVVVPQGALAEGAVSIVVSNPPPAACTGRSDTALYIVPRPTVTSVEPNEFCEATGGTITIHGSDFTPVATVKLTNADNSGDATEITFVDAGTITATFGPNMAPGHYDLTVTNADGCEFTLAGAVTVQPTPLVFFVDPPVLYNGIAIQVTIYVSGLTADAASVRLLGPNGEEEWLDGSSRPGQPNRIQADVPAGLAPGAWAVEVTSQTGCVGVLPGAITVTADVLVGITAVEPAFVSPSHPTAVTVTATPDAGLGTVGFESVPRVYLNPNPVPQGAVAAAMRAIVYLDDRTLNGVVPADLQDTVYALAPGTYDVIVVNPDATVGVLVKGLTVTAGEPPVIRAVVPGSLDNNAPQPVRISGEFLDAASVSMTCKDPVTGVRVTLPGTVTGATGSTEVLATLPADSDQVGNGSICVVTVVNQDGASFNYSAISLKNPSQNLYPWSRGADMVEARRALSLAAGRPTASSRYLYAVGGDAGAPETAKTSVEAAAVDVFGEMRAWSLLRQSLPSPRTGTGIAPIGRFLYLVGGNDGTGPVDSVLRAQILDPLAAPEIADLDLTIKKGEPGLGKGVWYYRVSALFPDTDPSNPGGESLPGEVLTVQLPEVPGLRLTVIWKAVPGASAYRLYRTPAADRPIGDLQLLAEVPGAVTSYEDAVGVTDPLVTPLPSGSTGQWHPAASMKLAREALAVQSVRAPTPEPGDAATWYLYAFGGRAGTYHGTWEFATVHVAADGSQVMDPFQDGAAPLSAARAETGAWLVTHDDWSGVTAGEPWVIVGPGRNAGGAVGNVDGAPVLAGGALGSWQAIDNVGGGDRSGAGYAAANGYLFLFGGDPAASQAGTSGELCNDGGGCLSSGDFLNIRNWNSLGISLSEPRYRMGHAQESAFVFVAGGFNGTAATATVDQTVQ